MTSAYSTTILDFIRLLAFMSLWCISTTALSVEKIIVLTEQLKPFNYTESGLDHGEILGFATELIVAVLEEANLEYDIKIGPQVRAVQALDSTKNIMVYSMARSPAREQKYFWAGEVQGLNYSLYGFKSRRESLPKSMTEVLHITVGADKRITSHH